MKLFVWIALLVAACSAPTIDVTYDVSVKNEAYPSRVEIWDGTTQLANISGTSGTFRWTGTAEWPTAVSGLGPTMPLELRVFGPAGMASTPGLGGYFRKQMTLDQVRDAAAAGPLPVDTRIEAPTGAFAARIVVRAPRDKRPHTVQIGALTFTLESRGLVHLRGYVSGSYGSPAYAVIAFPRPATALPVTLDGVAIGEIKPSPIYPYILDATPGDCYSLGEVTYAPVGSAPQGESSPDFVGPGPWIALTANPRYLFTAPPDSIESTSDYATESTLYNERCAKPAATARRGRR